MKTSPQKSPPFLSIMLDQDHDCLNRPYSSGDLIQGQVLFEDHKETIIESVSIVFVGRCTSIVPTGFPWSHASQSIKTTHIFLTMQQPLELQTLKSLQLETPDSTLRIPFSFKFPSELLSHACEHRPECNPNARSARALTPLHLHPPPSFSMTNSEQYIDNLTDDKSRIDYGIFTSLRVKRSHEGRVDRLNARLPVFVEPHSEVDARFTTLIRNASSTLRQTYTFRDFFRRQSRGGYLFLRVAPPPPILSARIMLDNSPLLTTVKTTLDFTPWQHKGSLPRLQYVKVAPRALTRSNTMQSPEISSLQCSTGPVSLHNVHSRLVHIDCYHAPNLNWQDCRRDALSVANNELVIDGEAGVIPGLDGKHSELLDGAIFWKSTFASNTHLPNRLDQGKKYVGRTPATDIQVLDLKLMSRLHSQSRAANCE